MEIREVKIEEYWPLIVKNTVEFGQIAAAENPEFNRLAKCIYQVLQESFVHDATEYGVKRWESILGINPASGATLDDRKATILTYLSVKVPYTWRVLKQMLVPVLGGEDKFVMEYLNDEYKLVLHTDRLNDAMLATVSDLLERVLPMNIEVERYNHHIEVSWRDINKYAACVTREDMLAVNPDYKNDFTSDGEWIYPLTNMRVCSERYGKPPWYLFEGVTQKSFVTEMPEATNVYRMFHSSNFDEVRVTLPNFTSQTSGVIFGDAKIRRAVLVAPKWNDMGWLCNGASIETLEIDAPVTRLDAMAPTKGKYILRNVKLTTTQLSTADGAFSSAQLTRESALHVLDILPTYTSGSHKLTIGIHVDHQTDEEVLAAIANAEAKGWTLTVQWNGTPTSGISMTDLEEIWCKVSESEYGEYTDENGNRCTLDWGHYVTDTTEYKLFYSLVEAEQYFKLNKIEVNENE